MSAVVCGKRSLFEDLHSSPAISKRLRFTSGPSIDSRLEAASLLVQLHALFPDMEEQAVEKALEGSNNDLDSAIKSLNLLHLSSSQQQASATSDPFLGEQQGEFTGAVPSEGAKWVEVLVSEMMSATDLDSARARAMRMLEAFEQIVMTRSSSVIEEFQKENAALKEQNQGLMHDNQILKRAVAIQHERQQGYEGRVLELQQVKQLLAQYQEQVRTLELSNYSLTLHLRQAQEGSSMPGRFHPDVF